MAFLRCFHAILTLLKWHSYIASTAFKQRQVFIPLFYLTDDKKKIWGNGKKSVSL